ncbi:hypothetical protein [Halorussus pelagicus]|uniref:hypothetical protein n=1 Tax=Halorussus pelagicus TaxID=2505977 RepID=UPI00140E8ED2|nr:hypothetical protein [Halorussus pelagicus]
MTRCDGCGRQTKTYIFHSGPCARYCPSCEEFREENSIEAGENEQYKLRAAASIEE